MNFLIITDWYFYAVAIPAVFLLGISKSGLVGTVVGRRCSRRLTPR